MVDYIVELHLFGMVGNIRYFERIKALGMLYLVISLVLALCEIIISEVWTKMGNCLRRYKML